jgi:hypothetical protein
MPVAESLENASLASRQPVCLLIVCDRPLSSLVLKNV